MRPPDRIPPGPGGSAGPRAVPQLLGGALGLYRAGFATLFTVALAGEVALVLLGLTGRPSPLGTMLHGLGGLLATLPVWASLLQVVVEVLVAAALLQLADRATTSPGPVRPPWGDVLEGALGRCWPLLVLDVTLGLGVGLGIVLLVVPGLLLLGWWSVAMPVVVLERRRAMAALGRSRALVRGHFWHALWTVVLGGLALLVGEAVVVLGSALLGSLPLLPRLWQALGAALLAPYMYCLMVTLYHDLRARREGLDALPEPQQVQGRST